jgi:hypothetical protein
MACDSASCKCTTCTCQPGSCKCSSCNTGSKVCTRYVRDTWWKAADTFIVNHGDNLLTALMAKSGLERERLSEFPQNFAPRITRACQLTHHRVHVTCTRVSSDRIRSYIRPISLSTTHKASSLPHLHGDDIMLQCAQARQRALTRSCANICSSSHAPILPPKSPSLQCGGCQPSPARVRARV